MGFKIALNGWYLLGLPPQCTINEFLQDKAYGGYHLTCKNAIYIKKNAVTNTDCVILPSNPPGQIVIDDWGVIESSQMGTQKFNVSLGVWMEIEVSCYNPAPPEPDPEPEPNPCQDSPAPCGCDNNEPSYYETLNGEPCEPCEPGCNCYHITYVTGSGEPCNPQNTYSPTTGEPLHEPCIPLYNGEPKTNYEPGCDCPCDDDTQGGYGATLSPGAILNTLNNPPLDGYAPPSLIDPPAGFSRSVGLGLGIIDLIAQNNLQAPGPSEPTLLMQILEEITPHLTNNEPAPALQLGQLTPISIWYGSILDALYGSMLAPYVMDIPIFNGSEPIATLEVPADGQEMPSIPLLPISVNIASNLVRAVTPSIDAILYLLETQSILPPTAAVASATMTSNNSSGTVQSVSSGSTLPERIIENITISLSGIDVNNPTQSQIDNLNVPTYDINLFDAQGTTIYSYNNVPALWLYPPNGIIDNALQTLSNEPLPWVPTVNQP